MKKTINVERLGDGKITQIEVDVPKAVEIGDELTTIANKLIGMSTIMYDNGDNICASELKRIADRLNYITADILEEAKTDPIFKYVKSKEVEKEDD